MDKKYFASNLLPTREWMWINLNKTKTTDEPHELLILAQEIPEPYSELTEHIKLLQEYATELEYDYDRLYIRQVDQYTRCGYEESKWWIVGQRKETSKELQARLSFEQEELNKANDLERIKKENKEKAEYEQFLKLKTKFDKGGTNE